MRNKKLFFNFSLLKLRAQQQQLTPKEQEDSEVNES
jgi:hypothetical protein